jgi:hypothetical protein
MNSGTPWLSEALLKHARNRVLISLMRFMATYRSYAAFLGATGLYSRVRKYSFRHFSNDFCSGLL